MSTASHDHPNPLANDGGRIIEYHGKTEPVPSLQRSISLQNLCHASGLVVQSFHGRLAKVLDKKVRHDQVHGVAAEPTTG